MPTVQVLRNGQITLPSSFRKELGLQKGDIISAEIQNGQIVLTPVFIIKKNEKEKRASAKEKFFEKVDELRERTKDIPEEEIEAAISEAIDSVRKKERS